MLGASSFTDEKSREKSVNFVDYANVGESFYTLASGGSSINGIANICGLTVSVETGTTEETDAKSQSKKCTKAGKKAVNVTPYPTQSAANLAVSAGRAQLGFADTPVADYQVKQSGGKFKLVGAAYEPAPYGIAIAKNTGPDQRHQGGDGLPDQQRNLRQDLQEVGSDEHRNPRVEGQDQRRDLLALT